MALRSAVLQLKSSTRVQFFLILLVRLFFLTSAKGSCPLESYFDDFDCVPCTRCEKNQVVTRECARNEDRLCGDPPTTTLPTTTPTLTPSPTTTPVATTLPTTVPPITTRVQTSAAKPHTSAVGNSPVPDTEDQGYGADDGINMYVVWLMVGLFIMVVLILIGVLVCRRKYPQDDEENKGHRPFADPSDPVPVVTKMDGSSETLLGSTGTSAYSSSSSSSQASSAPSSRQSSIRRAGERDDDSADMLHPDGHVMGDRMPIPKSQDDKEHGSSQQMAVQLESMSTNGDTEGEVPGAISSISNDSAAAAAATAATTDLVPGDASVASTEEPCGHDEGIDSAPAFTDTSRPPSSVPTRQPAVITEPTTTESCPRMQLLSRVTSSPFTASHDSERPRDGRPIVEETRPSGRIAQEENRASGSFST